MHKITPEKLDKGVSSGEHFQASKNEEVVETIATEDETKKSAMLIEKTLSTTTDSIGEIAKAAEKKPLRDSVSSMDEITDAETSSMAFKTAIEQDENIIWRSTEDTSEKIEEFYESESSETISIRSIKDFTQQEELLDKYKQTDRSHPSKQASFTATE